MRTLYIECQMGAAGDMLLSALYELLDDKETFIDKMNHLGIGNLAVRVLRAETCGITGTRIEVSIDGTEEESIDIDHHTHEHEGHHHHHHGHGEHHHTHEEHHHHAHRTLADVTAEITSLPLPGEVLRNAAEVYQKLAKAEGKVHGKEVGEVHFHEVGAKDAVVDIVGVCYALYLLNADRIIVSPVHAGSGHVKCAHGIVPVPAPATAELLTGIPFCSGNIQGELCTPTGAALLAHFGNSFCSMPVMSVDKCGYGIGKKVFKAANCVRIFLGNADESQTDAVDEEISELSCNLDDMTPEAVGYACEVLMKKGALDVFVIPIQMKKGRPGVLLQVLCDLKKENYMAEQIFHYTTTNGIRRQRCGRYVLQSGFSSVKTVYGDVRIKTAAGYGVRRSKPEYEDVVLRAGESGVSFKEVWDQADREAGKKTR